MMTGGDWSCLFGEGHLGVIIITLQDHVSMFEILHAQRSDYAQAEIYDYTEDGMTYSWKRSTKRRSLALHSWLENDLKLLKSRGVMVILRRFGLYFLMCTIFCNSLFLSLWSGPAVRGLSWTFFAQNTLWVSVVESEIIKVSQLNKCLFVADVR